MNTHFIFFFLLYDDHHDITLCNRATTKRPTKMRLHQTNRTTFTSERSDTNARVIRTRKDINGRTTGYSNAETICYATSDNYQLT